MARKSSKKSGSKSGPTAPKARTGTSSARPSASRKTLKKSARPATPAARLNLVEGDLAPPFTLKRDGDATISLADFAGRKLVVFFYPRADTPGCTLEAVDFTRLSQQFEKAGASVVGISADDVRAQTRFRDKHGLTIPLGADAELETVKAYGVWGEKSMYGKAFLGIIRTTVLIGADGRVARIWRNVKVDGHAANVLEAAKAL